MHKRTDGRQWIYWNNILSLERSRNGQSASLETSEIWMDLLMLDNEKSKITTSSYWLSSQSESEISDTVLVHVEISVKNQILDQIWA